MTWVMALAPVVLLVLGFPFFVVLLATSVVVLLFFSDVPTTALQQVMLGAIDQFALLAVPFFIFAGELMTRGNITGPLVRWVLSIAGGRKGCLPLTALGAATIFGALSGSTTASVATIGSLTYKPMIEAHYGRGFTAALLASTGAIANIIPPSIAMILYGAASYTSVVALFAAGIVPGLLFASAFGLYIYIYAARRGLRDGNPFHDGRIPRCIASGRLGLWRAGDYSRWHLRRHFHPDRGGRRRLCLCRSGDHDCVSKH